MTEHPALDRLQRLERLERRPSGTAAARPAGPPKMGYQPTLDGVRAVSVIAVMLYHAGFSWAHGGFFGVEVFFVVSGFLITSLLIEEHDGSGKVGLGQFYLRRARRLLPALFTVLIAVGVWAVFWGSTEQQVALRRDYPWGIGYLANWGAIFSQGSYWGAGAPKLLRHLWSLAVEEQWYLLWPLTFIAIRKGSRGGARANERIASRLAMVAIAVMVGTSLAQAFHWASSNALYLSTITRSSGLLLGAAMAFVWRPWRRVGKRAANGAAPPLGPAAAVAVLVLAAMVVVGRVDRAATYLWQLPLVTIASAVLVAVVVHPWATGPRAIFGWQPLVEIGKRSYGLYLWSWPISAMVGADEGSFTKFLLAMAITIPVSEACYRLIEAPIRRGALGRWWKARERRDWNTTTLQGAVAAVALVVPLTLFFADRPAVFDPAADAGNSDVVFDPTAVAGAATSTVPSSVVQETVPSSAADTTAAASTTAAAPVTTAASLPRRVVIVGDSTAHSLAINLPSGIEGTFTIGDGSVEGCSVYDSGKGVSTRPYTRTFDNCAGWSDKWVSAAQSVNAEVALVVLGAWDVFDVQTADGQTLAFGTPANDQRFMAGVQEGIDKLSAIGVKVALLEIPCMRPQDVQGAGVPALPERGDDARVAHLNDLLRQVAAANPATTTFVNGPAEYCADPAIAADLAYRWDGVHAYKPGAKLTFEAAAAQLLAIPV
ncbi:MAG: acyltransferase [Ilumatobacter sp.]|nr:acyltransferase [Ilumatobacter sp.]